MSNGDKRSVTTDALATLGTIIGESEKRDAIHLAVEPVIAGEDLEPGDHVIIKDGVATFKKIGKGQGIVDPFLTNTVYEGERFWFIMYPRMVHSLRHVWTHPNFPDVENVVAPITSKTIEQEVAKAWLINYADEIEIEFDDLIDSAGDWIDNKEYLVRGGVLEGVYTPSEFWDNYIKYTGREVPVELRTNFFSCSC